MNATGFKGLCPKKNAAWRNRNNHCPFAARLLGATTIKGRVIVTMATTKKARHLMADETGTIVSDNVKANGEDTAPAVGMLNQYIKDLSVENPHAPHSFNWDTAPQIDVQVNIQANAITEEVHEITLKLAVKAESENGVHFSVELDFGTLFGLRNVSEEQAHPFLFGEAPRLMFPFARRIVADAVRDAGYPPLVLEPIDFNALYIQQLAQAQQMAETQPAGEA
jgi:preprotein translocase subunit SecB